MKSYKIAFLLFSLGPLLLDVTNAEVAECTVSANGEEVRTNKDMQATGNGGNGSKTYDDDDIEDANVEEDEKLVPGCEDAHELCSFWANKGECDKNPNYMLNNCRISCNTCPQVEEKVELIDGLTMAQVAEKQSLLDMVAEYGVPQTVSETETQAKTMFVIRQTVDYMKNFIHADKPTHKISKETVEACTNNEKLCSFWSSIGECDNNPSFMVTKCAPACKSCHKIDYNNRCGKRDPNLVPGLRPGELNLMFERIVETAPGNASDTTQFAAANGEIQDDGMPIYTVTVHSRPKSPSPKPDDNGVIPINRKLDGEESPWVITFDNFLTDEECDHLIQLGYQNEYKRSTDVGKRQVDGTYSNHQSTTRTSENSWCSTKSGCRADPIVERVMKRLETMTGVPTENYEDFQMLKYQTGQFYRSHHDYIDHQKDRHNGPRILTFFLYLSDVEEGGGTYLNTLDLEIKPKRGRALLWPSVMNYNPMIKDPRTMHEAKDVIRGTKFAANAWIHLFNNVEAHKMGCN